MRLGLILCILGLTALLFYTAVQSNATTTRAQVAASSTKLIAEHASFSQASAAQISDLEAQIERLNSERLVLDNELKLIKVATEEIATLQSENSALLETVSSLQSEIQMNEAGRTDNAELVSQNADMSELVANLEADLATLRAKEVEFDGLVVEKDVLSAELVRIKSELSAMNDSAEQNEVLSSQHSALTEEISILRAELSSMQRGMDEAQSNITALNDTIDRSEIEKRALEDQLADLQSVVNTTPIQDTETLETQISTLKASLDEKVARLRIADESIAALTDEVAFLVSVEGEIVETKAANTALQADIAVRDLAITELRAQGQSESNSSLTSCQERSNAAVDSSGITFLAGTTSLAPTAISQLETIAAIAIDCAQNDLLLEIEGHTDSEGGDASNLLLSNGRAKAVHNFLIDKGVPSAAIRSVGFGKSDPIADNATADGRAKNERIVFDWEQF